MSAAAKAPRPWMDEVLTSIMETCSPERRS
jgi:hypothetical protein